MLTCRTGGLAGPARYTCARAKREKEGRARGQKNPPVVTPLFMLFRPQKGYRMVLQAFATMRAVRLFLRAGAVINFLMRAASTLKIINGEQRALRKFSASWNLSLLKGVVLRQVIWLTLSKQDNRRKARRHDKQA